MAGAGCRPCPHPPVIAGTLPDEVLAQCLSGLPLPCRVQLACCSRRLHTMVTQGPHMLQAADFHQVRSRQGLGGRNHDRMGCVRMGYVCR
jgi:F-box domain